MSIYGLRITCLSNTILTSSLSHPKVNKLQRKPKGQTSNDYPQTQAIFGTKHRTKAYKTNTYNTENLKDEQHGSTKTPGMNPGARKG